MAFNATYLMDLAVPRVEQLSLGRAQHRPYYPLDGRRLFDEGPEGGRIVDDIMQELFNRRYADYEEQHYARLPELEKIAEEADPARRVDAVWNFFRDRVDRASLYLHALAPDLFVFYRKMDIEEAIFESLAALSGGYPELHFEFSAVPLNGREEYEQLNQGLQVFSQRFWPDSPDRALKLTLLLYWVLPELTRPERTQRRYWVGMAKAQNNIDEVIAMKMGGRTEWSATYRVEKDDYYLMYCTAPIAAVTGIFRAVDRSWCDPTGGWKGHWVEIEKVADASVPFKVMDHDEVLSTWGPVMRSFQGTVLEQVPPRVFNRLRELFVEQGMPADAVEAAALSEFYASGEFATEREFEEERIRPLLNELGFGESLYQHVVKIWMGCAPAPCRIDFLVRDDKKRIITLFEDKQAIKVYRHAEDAYNQARSYALQLGLRSFVVAAPEGLKVYGRQRREEQYPPASHPLFESSWPELENDGKRSQFRDLLLRYAPKDD